MATREGLNDIFLTETRWRALQLVADGDLQYSLSMGTWEPNYGDRLPAFTWLDEHGLIEPDYDGPAAGRVTQRVRVHVTNAGREALATALHKTEGPR